MGFCCFLEACLLHGLLIPRLVALRRRRQGSRSEETRAEFCPGLIGEGSSGGYQQGALCPSGLCGASPECGFCWSCPQLWFLVPKPSLPGRLFSPLTAHCSEITPHGVERFKDNRGTRLIIPSLLLLPPAQMAKVSLLLKNKIRHKTTHTRKALAR